ncbi:putative oxidoreductase YtbE [mine drainage metagenome]|uniref:Putative oxidoreductase YtbE n=1 Tax=mine drainage metagenome TaxID=410659 RepID=A0A1J5TRP5_9ZZZZ
MSQTLLFSTPAEGLRSTATLNNGIRMPRLGLGVFQMPTDDATASAVRTAIELGYRSIDTASLYGNERGVGQGVRDCGVPRSEIFVTTKVWNDDMRAGRVEAAFEQSMKLLGLDYVDLYLLHWPIKGKLVSSWRVLEKLHRSGRIRAIGVSNYMIPHLDELLAQAEVVPAVNQIEFHPYLQSKPLVEACRRRGIQLEAWSPLQQAGSLLADPVLSGIAARHGKTVAQVVLRWDLQSGVVTIPKSTRPERMAENATVFDFALSDPEMTAIAALDRNARNGADPFNFNF